MLPDVRKTRAAADSAESLPGPEQFKVFGAGFLRKVNFASWASDALLFVGLFWVWGLDLISSLIITFFGITFLRKLFLDWKFKRWSAV